MAGLRSVASRRGLGRSLGQEYIAARRDRGGLTMTSYGRRGFILRTAAAALALREAVLAATQAGMRLGLIVSVGNDPERAIARVHDLGFPTCQASVADFGDAMVRGLRVALERHRVEATAINTSGPGPQVYDFYQGPQTIGVVPRRYRRERIDRLKRSSDFAKKLGIPAIHKIGRASCRE